METNSAKPEIKIFGGTAVNRTEKSMNNTLVKSQKGFLCEIFKAFTASRTSYGYPVEAVITDREFAWRVLQKHSNVEVYSWNIDRDGHLAFRSVEAEDIYIVLGRLWNNFEHDFYESGKAKEVIQVDPPEPTNNEAETWSAPLVGVLESLKSKEERTEREQKILDKCIQELEQDNDQYFYEPFYQHVEHVDSAESGLNHCFGLRWTEDDEQMPITSYGKTAEEAWEGFKKQLEQSAFRVVMIDIDELVKK